MPIDLLLYTTEEVDERAKLSSTLEQKTCMYIKDDL
jgi:hypothetical protein